VAVVRAATPVLAGASGSITAVEFVTGSTVPSFPLAEEGPPGIGLGR